MHPTKKHPKNMASKLVELKREIDKFITIVGDFDTPLSVTDTQSRQKISKGIDSLKNTINWLEPNYMYRKLHPTAKEYAFSSS